ncbi:MAG TPA: hypothetical protein VF476_10335 [Chitinophagaceae bacterium]
MVKACYILFFFFMAACTSNGKNKAVITDTASNKPKDTLVSIKGFWIDSSEISSNEYREYKADTSQKTKVP